MDVAKDEVFLFDAPFLRCRGCSGEIPLTYGPLPRITLAQSLDSEFEDQTVWPPDEWRATVGCHACGRVDSYSADDVETHGSLLGAASQYHDSATLFVAKFPCGKLHCKAPATVYANTETGGAAEFLRRLRSGFYQGRLPCGHDLTTVPDKFYSIERISQRLW
jgi:hypothetical protein